MILLVHMLFGAAIGSAVNNVPLAILLSLLGHYFLDTFPHIEYLSGVEDSIKKLRSAPLRSSWLNGTKVLLDFSLGLLGILLLSGNRPLIYICALAAIIPDGLTVVSNIFPNRLSSLHDVFHTKKIHFLKHKKIPVAWRIATQVAAIVFSAIILKTYS